jgi:hypothetical protein
VKTTSRNDKEGGNDDKEGGNDDEEGETMTRGRRRADNNRAEPFGSALFLSFLLITLHVQGETRPREIINLCNSNV